ncbi:virulence factor SrfB [Dactylosporangium sp. NPDC000521]|uniref:virulence factor SrfB n=1 Tax=Dactylosporangium sp. NPDC000521 TaxID=3363975 RepID=UPI003687347D
MTQPETPLATAAPVPRDAVPARRDAEDPSSGLVAIDFGTSSSTVTLWDASYGASAPVPVSQLQVLRLRLADLLADRTAPRGPDQGAPPAWVRDAVNVAETVLKTGSLTPDALIRALRSGSDTNASLVHRILLELDRRRRNYGPAADWLGTQLHELYDAAFTMVALELHDLHTVKLSNQSPEIPSRLEIVGFDPLAVRLGREYSVGAPGEDGSEPPFVQSLKNHLMRPQPDEYRDEQWRASTDNLLGAALSFLVDKAEAFIEASGRRFDTRPLDAVVLTYPTMSPPPVRQRMREIGQRTLGISVVDLHYDEAVAASLFFLMRELSGDYAIGVESLRSRMRPVPDRERHWHENVLVIDIGGGTTDIALLMYELRDRSPAESLADAFSGRRYEVLPRVLGSSGKARRGGDFLTLQVFHWLKALIADRILDPGAPADTVFPSDWADWRAHALKRLPSDFRGPDGAYVPGSLVEQMLVELGADTAGLNATTETDTLVRRAVDRILHTRWAGEQARGQDCFWLLWELAEEVKKGFGAQAADGAVVLRWDQVHRVVELSLAEGVTVPSTGIRGVELPVRAFRSIVEPMLLEITMLARSMAANRLRILNKEGMPERLDRIILTGKASQLPLVREVVQEQFGHLAVADGEQGWQTDEVLVESRYPKQATSIGAAWAASRRMMGRSDRDRRPLPTGETAVKVTVDNLFISLPCSFAVLTDADQPEVLLEAGSRFTKCGTTTLRARAWVGPLPEAFNLRRNVEGGDYQRWGSLRVSHLIGRYNRDSRDHPGRPELSERVWLDQANAMVEVDPDLDAWLLIWHGDEPLCRVVDDDVVARVNLDIGPLEPDPVQLAAAVRVGGRPVLAGGRRFRYRVPGREPSVLVAGTPVGAPGPEGWLVELDVPGAEPVRVPVRVDEEDDTAPLFTPLLDDGGRLRFYRGQLPLEEHDDPAEVQREPGLVLRRMLTAGASDDAFIDDPFCGVH